jgi:hypothetical protein
MSERSTGLLSSPQERRRHQGSPEIPSEGWIYGPFGRFAASGQLGGNALDKAVQLAATVFGMGEH